MLSPDSNNKHFGHYCVTVYRSLQVRTIAFTHYYKKNYTNIPSAPIQFPCTARRRHNKLFWLHKLPKQNNKHNFWP